MLFNALSGANRAIGKVVRFVDKVEVVVVGIGGRMGKQHAVKEVEERVVVFSNTPLLQTPKLSL